MASGLLIRRLKPRAMFSSSSCVDASAGGVEEVAAEVGGEEAGGDQGVLVGGLDAVEPVVGEPVAVQRHHDRLDAVLLVHRQDAQAVGDVHEAVVPAARPPDHDRVDAVLDARPHRVPVGAQHQQAGAPLCRQGCRHGVSCLYVIGW